MTWKELKHERTMDAMSIWTRRQSVDKGKTEHLQSIIVKDGEPKFTELVPAEVCD